MIIIWGKKIVKRKLGFVGEFCPYCRGFQAMKLTRVGLAGHVYYLSVGKGDLVRFDAECLKCRGAIPLESIAEFENIQKRADPDVERLLSMTQPNARTAYAQRLELEHQVLTAPLSLEPIITRQAALERIVSAETAKEDWFAASFLKAVPISQIQMILVQMRAQLGVFKEVQPDGRNFLTIYEKGRVLTQITLDKQGRVIGLFFAPPQGLSKSLEEALAGFKALPGKASVLALEDGKMKAELNPDEPLAVGSVFKLAILVELKRRIEAGTMAWNQVETLREEWKSLPSGILQEWPGGSTLTLNTLATLMISQSDNTATDHLARLLGAERLEKISPRNAPFLTTFESFRLKYGPKAEELAKKYIAADESERRKLLVEVNALPLPSLEDFDPDPVALEIEWYMTAHELHKLMEEVRDLPLMSINPGVLRKDDWQRISYKGGSEPGVISLVTSAQSRDGREITLIASWNNPEAVLDEDQFYLLYGDLAEQLK